MDPERLLFIDIESLPAGDPVDPKTLTPPGNLKKPETIAAWYETEAPAKALEQFRARALDSMQGRILCIGWATREKEGVICEDTEFGTLTNFAQVIEQIYPWGLRPLFVGWNVEAFDLPWLWRKAVQYGVKPLRKGISKHRNGVENCVDLMRVWSADWRQYNKLEDVAAFLGLPQKINGIDGSKVYDLYLEGRIDEIMEYCLGDVRTVRSIYERIYQ